MKLLLLFFRRYKLRNIEETEAAKKMLQEKRLVGKPKSDSNIPSSYSADYFHRGREHNEKLRRGLLHAPFQDYFLWETGGDPSTLLVCHILLICKINNTNAR